MPREVGGAERMGLKLGRGRGGKGSMIRYGMGERGGRPIPLSLQDTFQGRLVDFFEVRFRKPSCYWLLVDFIVMIGEIIIRGGLKGDTHTLQVASIR